MSAVLIPEGSLFDELVQSGNASASAFSALAQLLDELEWKGSLNELMAHLPLEYDALDDSDIRDILSKVGYGSQLRRGRISSLPDCDLPTLGFLSDGRVVVLKSYGIDGLVALENGSEIMLEESAGKLRWLELQPSALRAPQRGMWFRDLMEQFPGPILAVFILSFVNAVLGLALPLFTMAVYDFLIPSGSISGLVAVGSGTIIALVWLVAGNRLRARMLSRLAANMNYQIGRSLFSKLVRAPGEYLIQSTEFQNTARIRDTDRIREFIGGITAASLFDLPFIVVALVAIGMLAGWLVLVPLFGALVYLLLAVYFNSRLMLASRNAGKTGQRRQQLLRQALGGLDELRQTGSHSEWGERFSSESVRAARSNFNYAMVSALQQVVGRGMSMLIALSTLMTGIYLVLTGTMSPGGLIAAMMLIWRVTGPLQLAFFSMSRLRQFNQSVKQINAIMDTPYEKPPEKTYARINRLEPSIEAERVVFRYSPERDAALNGATFSAEPGSKVAVVGANGSGKSTLLACLAGLLHSQSGTVRVGGHDIRQFSAVDYRNEVAYLSSDPDFLDGTIYDNLRAAVPLANREQMHSALVTLGVGDYLSEHFEGLDTVLMKQGRLQVDRMLARGIGMARVILRDPSIILIDDLFENGDHPVNRAFCDFIDNLPEGKTLIFATHDSDFMLKADLAVIMDKGAVAQVAELNQDATSNSGEQVP